MSPEIERVMVEQAEGGDSLAAVALAIDRLATQVKYLGNADACTPMGGLEALGAVLKDGMSEIASAISETAA